MFLKNIINFTIILIATTSFSVAQEYKTGSYKFKSTPRNIMGDAIDGESSNLSKHFRAERVTIAYNTLVNNTHGIEIGYDNNDNYGKDLKDIIIANNLVVSQRTTYSCNIIHFNTTSPGNTSKLLSAFC